MIADIDLDLTIPAIDYAELDPGIRDLVRLLRSNGFATTDSGDGKTKLGGDSPMECAEPTPNVYMEADRATMLDEAERLTLLLHDHLRDGVLDEEIDIGDGQMAPRVIVEAIYLPISYSAVLSVHGVTDEDIAR